jgi:hypothetical protein
MPEKKQITLVYLARKAEGIAPVRAFVESYRNFPAGIDHDLLVICKGADNNYIRAVKHAFGKDDAAYLARSDEGVDIHAYLDAARQIETTWVCFLNTFSIIRKSRWLEKMFAAATLPSVGLVGATASYEALIPSIKVHIWFISRLVNGEPMTPETLRLFAWLQAYTDGPGHTPQAPLRDFIIRLASSTLHLRWRQAQLQSRRTNLLRHYEYLLAELGDIPDFPNPHIRSNGFMVRTDFLRQRFPELGHDKLAAYRFESGLEGLTGKILGAGLTIRMVGDDASYDIPNWPDCKIYRSGNQEQLLIGDNQTANFDALSDVSRELYRYMTWGDRAIVPEKFAHIIPDALQSSAVKETN